LGGTGEGGNKTRETLQEREVRYQAARDRIFKGDEGVVRNGIGGAGDGKAGERPIMRKDASASNTTVIRSPRGPTASSDGPRGFASRKSKQEVDSDPPPIGKPTG
jgi:hypothetical protein